MQGEKKTNMLRFFLNAQWLDTAIGHNDWTQCAASMDDTSFIYAGKWKRIYRRLWSLKVSWVLTIRSRDRETYRADNTIATRTIGEWSSYGAVFLLSFWLSLVCFGIQTPERQRWKMKKFSCELIHHAPLALALLARRNYKIVSS